jgi:hypothetical protein
LVREDSVTNQVASPVKFAEYLAAGLQIIISEKLGDYSALVAKEGLGIVYSNALPLLSKISYTQKSQTASFALNNFTKEKYIEQYRKLLQ